MYKWKAVFTDGWKTMLNWKKGGKGTEGQEL